MWHRLIRPGRASLRYWLISALRADREGWEMCTKCLHIGMRERVSKYIYLAWKVLCRDGKIVCSRNVKQVR